jgi:hypothetical protein
MNGGPLHRALPKAGHWFYEPKYNGWRALVHVATGAMFNREGQPLTISGEFEQALGILRRLDCAAFKWADCEALERRHGIGKGTLIVLDVIPEPAWANATYETRRQWTATLADCDPYRQPAGNTIYRVPHCFAPCLAPVAWGRLQELNRQWGCDFYEGLVAKRADSPYPIQLRSPKAETPFWIKHRWTW